MMTHVRQAKLCRVPGSLHLSQPACLSVFWVGLAESPTFEEDTETGDLATKIA